MTLNEYINKLIEFRDSDKKNGKLKVIYAKDSEGNGYDTVYYVATPCVFHERDWVHFFDEDEFNSEKEFNKKVNAVCIN